jgi:tetratricopeptide (TPR) repeat protein
LKRKKFKDIDFCISKVISCDSTDLSSWIAVEDFYSSIGNKKKAKEIAIRGAQYYSKTLSLESKSEVFANISYLFYNINKLDSALKYINLAITVNPTNIPYLFQKSIIAIDKKDFSQADSALNFALNIDPKNEDVLLQKGKLLFNHLDKDKVAMEVFKNIIDIDTTHQEANWYIGRIHYWNSVFDSSILYFDKAAKYDSSDAYSWYWLGLSKLSYCLEKNIFTNFSDYEFLKSLKINQSLYMANWYIGCIAYLNRDKKRAINYFKQSIHKDYYDLEFLDYNPRLKNIKFDTDFKFILSRKKRKK